MKLFQKNIFSGAEAAFTKLTSEYQLELSSVIELFYPELIVKEVYGIGAFEINSNNWRIETDKGPYILKRAGLNKFSTLTAQSTITATLQSNSFPTLDFVKNKYGQLLSSDEKFAYCLTRFENGNYFGSSAIEWTDLVSNLKFLSDLCSNKITEIKGIPSRDFFTPEEDLLIKKLKKFLLKEISAEQLSVVINEYEAIRSFFAEHLFLFTKGIFHVDIHPHNLIFKNSKLSLLTDFEGFQLTVPKVSLGFGLYKCMRQLLVITEENKREELTNILNEQFKIYFKNFTLKELLFYAKADVLKRILYILRELLEENASPWLFALEIQLVSLEEINEINKILK